MAKKRSSAFIATEKLLIAIRDNKPINTYDFDPPTVARLISYCEKDMRLPAIKEIRVLAGCGLKDALDLYMKYMGERIQTPRQ